MRVGVVGAGMAGMACAQALRQAGHAVVLVDKGRGAGGRMATRRLATALGEVSFDHGAQYFTARDPMFRDRVDHWVQAGQVSAWTVGKEVVWVGTPTMNTPLKAMALDLEVLWSVPITHIMPSDAGWTLLSRDGPVLEVDAVAVALPAEQAADLLAPVAPDMAAKARSVVSAPCWTVMLAFAERLKVEVDWLRGDVDSPVNWAVRDSAKPGRGTIEAWVIQAGAEWSARHLEHRPEDIVDRLSAALSNRIGTALPLRLAGSAHRWRYARSGRSDLNALWDDRAQLGVCGDWLIGPRVEAAWLSGTRLAAKISADPGTSR